jgi:cytochrome c oxidase cbb3-type subunit 3
MRSYATATIPDSNLQPGGTLPIPQGGVSGATVHNPYEGNAYAISEGRQLYVMYNCVGCHMNGGGDIGPPLINAKYRYGDAPSDIYKTIVYGRPHGMPAWGTRIPEYQIWELVTYVLSMRGSEPSSATPARDDSMQRTREQTQ